MKKLKAVIALTRCNEIYDYTLAITLLAAVFSGIEWQWRILLIVITNILAQCFAFMINDVEDAEDDAKNPKKLKRNPVSHKALSRKEGFIYAGIAALLSILLFGLLAAQYNPLAVIIIAVTTLITMFCYSWKKVRFKSMPVMDFLSHIYMLAGAPYLLAYFSFRPEMDLIGFLGLGIVLSISGYGIMENQIRDYETDKLTQINNSTSYIGIKIAKLLRFIFAVGGGSMIMIYIWKLPDTLTLLLKVGIFGCILAIFPLVKYVILKNQEGLKTDLHRLLLLLGYVTLLAQILHLF